MAIFVGQPVAPFIAKGGKQQCLIAAASVENIVVVEGQAVIKDQVKRRELLDMLRGSPIIVVSS